MVRLPPVPNQPASDGMSNFPRKPQVRKSPDVIACCDHESYCLKPLSEAAEAWTRQYLPANWDYGIKFLVDENRYDLSRNHYEYAIEKMNLAGLKVAEFDNPIVFEELVKILDGAAASVDEP